MGNFRTIATKRPGEKRQGISACPMEASLQYDFWVLITGSRWCDVPKGKQWGSRPSAHRWLGRWQKDGTLDRMLEALLETADLAGFLDWERLAADGFFFCRERRRQRDRIWV